MLLIRYRKEPFHMVRNRAYCILFYLTNKSSTIFLMLWALRHSHMNFHKNSDREFTRSRFISVSCLRLNGSAILFGNLATWWSCWWWGPGSNRCAPSSQWPSWPPPPPGPTLPSESISEKHIKGAQAWPSRVRIFYTNHTQMVRWLRDWRKKLILFMIGADALCIFSACWAYA